MENYNRFNFGNSGDRWKVNLDYDFEEVKDAGYGGISDEDAGEILNEGLAELLGEGALDDDLKFLDQAAQTFAKKSVMENLTRLRKKEGIMDAYFHVLRTYEGLVEGTPLGDHYEERLGIAGSNALSFVNHMNDRNMENAKTLSKLLKWKDVA